MAIHSDITALAARMHAKERLLGVAEVEAKARAEEVTRLTRLQQEESVRILVAAGVAPMAPPRVAGLVVPTSPAQ